MRALTISEPGKTAVHDIAEPALQPNDVLVRVRTVGLCESDLKTFRGLNPMVTYPRVPGHEIAGVIEATGAMVPGDYQVGQAVTLSPYSSCGRCPSCQAKRFHCCQFSETLGVQRDGGLTRFLAVPWRQLFTSTKLGFRELALVEPLAVGFHAVDRGRTSAEDRVAVLGCSAIGLGAIAGAAARDAKVIAVDIDDTKLELARQAGAMDTINSERQQLHSALQELTDGDGPNLIIEDIGLPLTAPAAVNEVAFAGRVVYIGYSMEQVMCETEQCVQKELAILGSRNAEPGNFRSVIKLLEGNHFPADAMVSRIAALDETGQALDDWAAAPATITRIHIDLPTD